MILSLPELRFIGPALALLEVNGDLSMTVTIGVTGARRVMVEIMGSGILVREDVVNESTRMEFYAKPMGLALAYKLRYLEDLLYPNNEKRLHLA